MKKVMIVLTVLFALSASAQDNDEQSQTPATQTEQSSQASKGFLQKAKELWGQLVAGVKGKELPSAESVGAGRPDETLWVPDAVTHPGGGITPAEAGALAGAGAAAAGAAASNEEAAVPTSTPVAPPQEEVVIPLPTSGGETVAEPNDHHPKPDEATILPGVPTDITTASSAGEGTDVVGEPPVVGDAAPAATPSASGRKGKPKPKATELVAAEDLGYVDSQGQWATVPRDQFESALEVVNLNFANLTTWVTRENVVKVGVAAMVATVIWQGVRYTVGLPVSAFLIGMGMTSSQAAEYCSVFDGEEGIRLVKTLSYDEQLEQAEYCPQLAGNIMALANAIESKE